MQYEPIKRNRYTDPDSSTEGDFSAINFDEDFNEFHLPLNRMQLSNFQEWGVAQGLEVSGSIGGTTLTIAPGVAVDIRGQLISLSPEGRGDIGSNPSGEEHEEIDVPVNLELSRFAQAEDTAYFVTIQFSQILRFTEGPLGRYEYVPWVSLQSVAGFIDDGISVILARVVINAEGQLGELQTQGRRLVSKTVQQLLLRRPQVTGEQLGQVSAGKIAATENGLQISVTDPENEVLLSQENDDRFSQLEVGAENSIFQGDLKVSKDLTVEGAISTGSLTVQDAIAATGSLTVDGNVGIGTTNPPQAKLHVNGSESQFTNDYAYFFRTTADVLGNYNPGTAAENESKNNNYSIHASDSIRGQEFHAFSDSRTKDIKGVSDSQSDLKVLRQIGITDYTYKDKIAKHNKPHKKVIGQQIAKVFPQAVKTHIDVVPDIFQPASIANGWINLVAHGLQVGERVRLLLEGSEPKICTIEAVTPDSFQVSLEYEGNVFVYGREVDDFHVVDYDALSMLHISATQELCKIIDALKIEVQQLKAQLNGSHHNIAAINEY